MNKLELKTYSIMGLHTYVISTRVKYYRWKWLSNLFNFIYCYPFLGFDFYPVVGVVSKCK